MHHNIPQRLLSRKEAAAFLGVKETTLAIWKSTQRYEVPCVKVGRLVKYRLSDLLDFVERRTVTHGAYPDQQEKKVLDLSPVVNPKIIPFSASSGSSFFLKTGQE